ncbi:MAG: deoxyguanosinetriphosphate triphosphohydrolase [Firmicutes bacterium]|nr:deoxyguanosinetriphosphate triphosphohydrolase [Bacillota bacterium]MDD4336923.1 deoxyguanosinetriphosphate triphosphohydrolase [Bacillota bacterium]
MTIRERLENEEVERLSPYAALSLNTRGRDREEKPDRFRTCYQRDRDRIVHCKAFRRLKHKTQVFLSPEGDHYRTRLTHTLEVAQIARTISRALRLNEDLTEAIAYGHDLGHTPFGHSGEAALNEAVEGGFRHNEQSLRVVEFVERREGKSEPGLNLTWEVRNGILCHSAEWPDEAATLEGQVVKYADKIAYVNHDVDDAMRAGIITEEMIPEEAQQILGRTRSERLDTLVKDLIDESANKERILMSPEVARGMAALRDFMFEKVYIGSIAKVEADKATRLLIQLYYYYVDHVDELIDESGESLEDCDVTRIAVDYIAGMTDRYAMRQWTAKFVPAPWGVY